MLRHPEPAGARRRGQPGPGRPHRPQRARASACRTCAWWRARAPAALAGLPAPDTVFIGGGVTAPGVLDAAVAALPPGGRLVANVVTLEGEAVLLAAFAQRGGTLKRLTVAHADPVGHLHGWRAAMPVTQWAWVKP